MQKKALPIIYFLEHMGHPQLYPTPISTDNLTLAGFVNKNMQMKASKTWDIQLHWLWDKENMIFLKFSGTKEKIKEEVIGPNIIQPSITVVFIKNMSMFEILVYLKKIYIFFNLFSKSEQLHLTVKVC